MKAHDFINSSIGAKVRIVNPNREPIKKEWHHYSKLRTEFTLKGLSRGGMALLEDSGGHVLPIPPRLIREVDK